MRKLFGGILIIIGLLVLIGFVLRVLPFPTKVDQQTVAVDGIKNLNINIDSENVEIVVENRKDIKIDLYKKSFQNVHLTTKQNTDDIAIGVDHRGWPWVFNGGGGIKIHIPEDYHANVDVKMNSGNFTFNGSTRNNQLMIKQLQLNIQSGNAKITDVMFDRLLTDLHSGNTDIERVTVNEQVDLNVSSGNMNIKQYIGPLNVETRSGNVTIQMVTLKKDITVNTWSGNIKLDLPNNGDFRIKAELKSGTIHNDIPLNDAFSGSNYLSGSHGKGTSLITIKGRSGNVNIY